MFQQVTYSYTAYELKIESTIELSSFQESKEFDKPDVHIIFGKVPNELKDDATVTIIRKARFQMNSNQLLYLLPDKTKVYVTDGNKITIETNKNTDWDYLKIHLRARALAGILHQRRMTPLHGSAIEVDGQAILFVGESGAGKSTLAAAFIKKGYEYLADDWCVFKKNGTDDYILQPSYPQLRLWEHALNLLDASSILIKGNAIRDDINKYYINPKVELYKKPIPVKAIYLLNWHPQSNIDIKIVDNFSALRYLIDNTFAKLQMEGLGGHQEQFKALTYLLNTTKIKKIIRPQGLEKKDFWNMVSEIEQDFLEKC